MSAFNYGELVAIRDALILLEPCGDNADEDQAIVDSALEKVCHLLAGMESEQ